MSKRRVYIGVLAAIAALVVSQVAAQLFAELLALPKIPAGVCNSVAGALYLGFAFAALKLLAERLFKLKLSDFGITKFSVKGRWILTAVLLPAAVTGFYLLFVPGEFAFSGMNGGEIFGRLGAGIFFTGIAAGFVEEMVFRGVIFRLIEKAWNIKAAVIIPSVLFGVVHILGAGYSVGSCLLVALTGTMVGIMFSLIAVESGSVWNSGIVHAVWNIVIIGGGISVGETLDEHSVATYILSTKSFALTGGDFGIESSAVALAGYVIVAAAAYIMIKKSRAEK